MVRIAVDNLEADFDLQLLGAEEPVEFEVSEECSEEICVPPGCTCLKFEAPRYSAFVLRCGWESYDVVMSHVFGKRVFAKNRTYLLCQYMICTPLSPLT